VRKKQKKKTISELPKKKGSLFGKVAEKFVLETSLTSSPMSNVFCGEHALGCVIALKSANDIKFSSFSPPLIEAASLEKLCNFLLDNHFSGDEFGAVFFHMLSTFCSSEEFGSLLLTRFTGAVRQGNVVLKQKILKTAIKWITVRPNDLKLESVKASVSQIGQLSEDDDYGKILVSETNRILDSAPPSAWPFNPKAAFVPTKVSVFSFSAITVAEQLTLISQAYFGWREEEEREMFADLPFEGDILIDDLCATKSLSPRVLEVVERSSRLQSYIVSSILRQTSRDTRSKAAAFWIEVTRKQKNVDQTDNPF
jgi:hypothetical protein